MRAERVQRRCRSCGNRILVQERPWVFMDNIGNEVAWHTTCPDPKEARRG